MLSNINIAMKLLQIRESRRKLVLSPLPYPRDALEPVMSRDTVVYHYDHLTKGYVDRFNDGEGDPDFNEAGAFMHELFWAQFRRPRSPNRPIGKVLALIEDEHGTFEDFRDAMSAAAKGIQGSGWVYLSRGGSIKTIPNHRVCRDALLPIDMWEHSWALDYKWDKDEYLRRIWRLIDWDVINHRLAGR
jgi:Fe-Mn family superoxide dismutase